MFTIEENALKCAICGLGVLEGGPMVGGSINNSIHPNCLLIDPFSDEVYTVEQVKYYSVVVCCLDQLGITSDQCYLWFEGRDKRWIDNPEYLEQFYVWAKDCLDAEMKALIHCEYHYGWKMKHVLSTSCRQVS